MRRVIQEAPGVNVKGALLDLRPYFADGRISLKVFARIYSIVKPLVYNLTLRANGNLHVLEGMQLKTVLL